MTSKHELIPGLPPRLQRPEPYNELTAANANLILLETYGRQALDAFFLRDEKEHVQTSCVPGLDF
jgi:hypothetical protein